MIWNSVAQTRGVMFSVIKKVYSKIFRSNSGFLFELGRAIDDCDSILELGCGMNSPLKYFSKNKKIVGVDLFEEAVKNKRFYDACFKMDANAIDEKFGENSFDCVVALDFIEHLEKKQGLKLLKKMEKIARKKVVIFTPNGFLKQSTYAGNEHQVHKSGWNAEEFKRLGFEVIGIGGLKSLKGEFAKVRFRPEFLWIFISDVTHFFLRAYPEHSFQILCVKRLVK